MGGDSWPVPKIASKAGFISTSISMACKNGMKCIQSRKWRGSHRQYEWTIYK